MKICGYSKTCTWVFVAFFFVIALNWSYPPPGKWLNKLYHNYAMEYYSVVTLLIQATVWMNPQNIMLDKRSQIHRVYTIRFYFCDILEQTKLIHCDKKVGISSIRYQHFLLGDGNVLYLDFCDCYMDVYQNSLIMSLK